MDVTEDFTNHFLIAMPGMTDGYFSRTVTYLCQHSGDGALGIVINRPSELVLRDIMRQMNITMVDQSLAAMPVYYGGPVQPERGFVIHDASTAWDSSISVAEGIALTTSRDILEAIANGEGPKRVLIALGYAGWSGGQLEMEMAANAWLSTPAAQSLIFDQPSTERWKAAVAMMGIDISLLSSQAGHA